MWCWTLDCISTNMSKCQKSLEFDIVTNKSLIWYQFLVHRPVRKRKGHISFYVYMFVVCGKYYMFMLFEAFASNSSQGIEKQVVASMMLTAQLPLLGFIWHRMRTVLVLDRKIILKNHIFLTFSKRFFFCSDLFSNTFYRICTKFGPIHNT